MSNEDFDIGRYTAPRSDQLNAEDFIAGPRTYTIKRVRDVGGTEQPVEIDLEEVNRPWRPCKTTMRVLAYGWGPRTGEWRGRQATLYRDPTVTWGNAEVGGIRISAMSDLPGDKARGFVLALAKSKKAKGQIEIRPIKREGQAPQQEPPKDEPVAPTASPDLLAKAELAASQGTVTLEGWWKDSASKEERVALQRDLARLKEMAREADERGAPTEGDPFGLQDGTQEREPGEEG